MANFRESDSTILPFCDESCYLETFHHESGSINKITPMSDDKTNKGTRDDVTIDANDASEVEYPAKQAGMTMPEFRELMEREKTNNRERLMEAAKKGK
jgi:hypothetical protein